MADFPDTEGLTTLNGLDISTTDMSSGTFLTTNCSWDFITIWDESTLPYLQALQTLLVNSLPQYLDPSPQTTEFGTSNINGLDGGNISNHQMTRPEYYGWNFISIWEIIDNSNYNYPILQTTNIQYLNTPTLVPDNSDLVFSSNSGGRNVTIRVVDDFCEIFTTQSYGIAGSVGVITPTGFRAFSVSNGVIERGQETLYGLYMKSHDSETSFREIYYA